jgi:putative flippase GtrA
LKQIIRFGIVGTIGFIVDAFILLLLVHIFDLTIELSRLFSFSIAVFVTWLINRSFTFSKNTNFDKKKEYCLYFILQTIGALINYIIFIVLVNNYTFFEIYLIIPLAIASIIAMFFNYLSIKKIIYS